MNHYFYYDENKKILWYSEKEESIVNSNLTFIGSSNNPNLKMAAAVFMKNNTGYSLKKF